MAKILMLLGLLATTIVSTLTANNYQYAVSLMWESPAVVYSEATLAADPKAPYHILIGYTNYGCKITVPSDTTVIGGGTFYGGAFAKAPLIIVGPGTSTTIKDNKIVSGKQEGERQ